MWLVARSGLLDTDFDEDQRVQIDVNIIVTTTSRAYGVHVLQSSLCTHLSAHDIYGAFFSHGRQTPDQTQRPSPVKQE